jgi:16S rRNA U516 pseudouridylate synthase RsuA-like enzyme
MFAAKGFHVTALERTRFGEWTLGELAPGEWRAVSPLPNPLPRGEREPEP